MKKWLLLCLCLISFSCSAYTAGKEADEIKVSDTKDVLVFDESLVVKDTGSKQFSEVSVKETVKNMSCGWNLGNTLDATGGKGLTSETSWQQPRVTKEMIHGLKVSEIKTIRIPISWSRHMDKTNYTVDQEWMLRVKEIVDWAIDEGLYVIINTHHDNWSSPNKMPACSGYYPNSKNFAESERYLANLWTQIGLAFNNGYDEHLIFETMNEPRIAGTNHEWWFDSNAAECKDAANCLNMLNQVVVNAIRATGGNNQKRFISVPGLQASPDSALNPAFAMPTDDEPGKLILSVHMYTPYNFAMESPGITSYKSAQKLDIYNYFKNLNTKFITKGYPVIVGEMGATNKNNLEDRIKWTTDFFTYGKQYGASVCLWDNGVWELKEGSTDYSEHYGFYNRTEQTWYFPELHKAMIDASK